MKIHVNSHGLHRVFKQEPILNEEIRKVNLEWAENRQAPRNIQSCLLKSAKKKLKLKNLKLI
jgi:hypothetical protein